MLSMSDLLEVLTRSYLLKYIFLILDFCTIVGNSVKGDNDTPLCLNWFCVVFTGATRDLGRCSNDYMVYPYNIEDP